VLISDPDRLIRDPWLAAAEISIAELAEKPLRFAKSARRLLESDIQDRHLSELAASLATAELKAGNVKQARRLLARALRDPTENSLAQAEWSAGRGVDVLQAANPEPLLNFEAHTRHALRDGDFAVAMNQAILWQGDQSFALDPAIHLSYIAATLSENYEVAIMACQKGLRTNPKDKTLLNNLAFAQANAGLQSSAQKTMSRLVVTDDDDDRVKWTSMATRGLIAFRQGAINEGRRLYGDSIQGWNHLSGEQDNAARAAIFWAREEIRTNTDFVDESMSIVDVLMSRASDEPDLKLHYERLIRMKTASS
jgi:tetratricopeptide (TPR) repeat protein